MINSRLVAGHYDRISRKSFVTYREDSLTMAFKFEDLRIWKHAIAFANTIYFASKKFDSEEKWNLTSQIRRAADSISLNIAEGSTGQSDNEQARFLGIAQRSCLEVVTCLVLAHSRGYLEQVEFSSLKLEAEQLVKSIQSMRAYLYSKNKKKD